MIAKGFAGVAKLLTGWDGLHACCPKRDILPNADPGELNPKDWPNDDGWLAAAATDPNNPLDATVVEGDPKIDDVVLVAAGDPKMDEEVVVPEPNIEVDDVGIDGLPNIDELVPDGLKTDVVGIVDPKPPVVFVVAADPNMEDTVVAVGAPKMDEVVFMEFPKIEDEVVVVAGAPKIEDVVDGFVVPNIDDEVVALVGAPNIEGALVVLVELPKIEEVLVMFVGAPKIEETLVVVFNDILEIEVLVSLVVVLNIEAVVIVLVEFPKILVIVELTDVSLAGIFEDEISKIGALFKVTGIVGAFSLSGVTGSDIIGVGLSEVWEATLVTFILVVVADAVVQTDVVLTTSKVDDTVEIVAGSLTIVESVLIGSAKLNEAVTDVADVVVKMDLVSDAVVLEILSLDAVKLNVENDESDFELKLNVANGVSFPGTVSCLFLDLSSLLNPEKILVVSKGFNEGFGVSKLKEAKGESFELSILFLSDSAKLNATVGFVEAMVVSTFVADTLVKLKGILSFDSVVPEIISKEDFVETILRGLLKFIGVVVDDFKLKFTGALLEVLIVATLFSNKELELLELKTTVSFEKPLKSNLFGTLFNVAGLIALTLSNGFQSGVEVLVGKYLASNVEVTGPTVNGIDVTTLFCWMVEVNKGLVHCVKSGWDINGNFISETLCLSALQSLIIDKDDKGTCGKLDTYSFVTIGVKVIFSWIFCFGVSFKGVLHTGLLISTLAYFVLFILVRLVLKSFNHSWSLITLELESALWLADKTEYFLAILYELIPDTLSLSSVIFNNCSESFDKPTSL